MSLAKQKCTSCKTEPSMCGTSTPLAKTHHVHEPGRQKTRPARTADFNVCHRDRDPNIKVYAAFKVFNSRLTPTPITNTVSAPMNCSQPKHYPDATQRARTHKKELENLDQDNFITWLLPHKTPQTTKPIPLTMRYRYERNEKEGIM